MRACTRVNVYCTLYTFIKLHDRRIANVGVRVRIAVDVGPVVFQLNRALGPELITV